MAKQAADLDNKDPDDEVIDVTGTVDDPEASEADLNAALNNGYDNKDHGVKEPVKKDEPKVLDIKVDKSAEEKLADQKAIDDQKVIEDADKKKLEAEEWANVPPAIRAKFTQMEADVLKANNTANSASGRAGKLQSELDKRVVADKPKPLPTSEQIKEAMEDPEKLKELEDQWPDIVAGINQGLSNTVNAVGDQIDKATAGMMKTWEGMHKKSQEELLNHIKVDIAHPGWQNTISEQGFKDWFYNGGPNPQESGRYEQLRAAENASKKTHTPEQTAVLAQQTSDYYTQLLVSYPTWAAERGNLYGSPSVDAAIELLDKHKTSIEAKVKIEDELKDEQGKETRKKILADNIDPTDGRGVKAPANNEKDANAAFLEGFNNPSY